MNQQGRPLSPHLSIYRWPITMALSILHRISGMALSAGLVVLAAWLISAASGASAYARFAAAAGSVPGRVLLVALSLAFFYHLANGIRHLVWDTGRGLGRAQANASSWFVLGAAAAGTLGFWVLVS